MASIGGTRPSLADAVQHWSMLCRLAGVPCVSGRVPHLPAGEMLDHIAPRRWPWCTLSLRRLLPGAGRLGGRQASRALPVFAAPGPGGRSPRNCGRSRPNSSKHVGALRHIRTELSRSWANFGPHWPKSTLAELGQLTMSTKLGRTRPGRLNFTRFRPPVPTQIGRTRGH